MMCDIYRLLRRLRGAGLGGRLRALEVHIGADLALLNGLGALELLGDALGVLLGSLGHF